MSGDNDDYTQLRLTSEFQLRGVEDEPNDLMEIDHPFDPNKIRVTTEPKTIDLIARRIDHNEIDLAPDFQRRARLWKLQKKSQLIESLLLRIPLPVFYVAADEDDMWSVVDGVQRLTTIHDFLNDEFRLHGLEYLSNLEEFNYTDLPRQMQRRIQETGLTLNVIQPGTPSEVMINIFKRINTGGLPLTAQEIRHALNKGPARTMLNGLASSEQFLRATDNAVKDFRMDAQECVLRFIAFRSLGWRTYDKNDLDAFLNDAMRMLNRISATERDELADDFLQSMEVAYAIFGRDAFRKRYLENGRRMPINKALFESWSVSLADVGRERQAILMQNANLVRSNFMDALYDGEFEASISSSTGSRNRVLRRFRTIELLLKSTLEEAGS
ncbi:DUF262 domain-containing protein [Williamsia muralis]|uniref:DUF262 domain-containing protein n=1 Tax=Williamsia marianensis TaxID=85044 RepID=UPI000DE5E3E5|nr:DUF262 domain-containing protein [Williamsia marianensis]PVY31756.1 uncharacterized protein DUF262 [Williamsia marianensis]